MRLLHISSLELKTFISDDVPPYAILSHTWGDEEFTFEDLQQSIHKNRKTPKKGLKKILDTCRQANRDGLEYVWVDTCCIDKSSSAELSEAINSMFQWYNKSNICYVFMEDVTIETDGTMSNFHTSRWFTRGWTLQELIAPHDLIFFDCNWNQMKRRYELGEILEKITGVERRILRRQHDSGRKRTYLGDEQPCPACGEMDALQDILSEQPIASKMKWASQRLTTREEDGAYCLLGLFNINMPLLYGEGNKAFGRLQEMILRNCPDQSILAWAAQRHKLRKLSPRLTYLSTRPSAFQFSPCVGTRGGIRRNDIVETARGLEIDVWLAPCALKSPGRLEDECWLAALSCAVEVDHLPCVAIIVKRLSSEPGRKSYGRIHDDRLVLLRPGTEPLLQTFDGYPNYGMSIDCDFDKFELRRILLAVQPPQVKHSDVSQLKLTIRGCGNRWHDKVESRFLVKNSMVLYGYDSQLGRFFSNFSGKIRVCGILFINTDRLAFFVIWGTKHNEENSIWAKGRPNKWDYELPEGFELLSWVEPLDSFLAPGSYESKEALETVISRIKRDKYPGKSDLNSGFSESDSQVTVQVERKEFLGKWRHTLVVDIQDRENHPLSVVDYREL